MLSALPWLLAIETSISQGGPWLHKLEKLADHAGGLSGGGYLVPIHHLGGRLMLTFNHRTALRWAAAAVAVLSASAQAATAGPLKLTKTFIDSGTMSGALLPASVFQVVGDQVTITCGITAGCTVSASLEAQIKQVGANSPALCFYVDDAMVSCPANDRLTATSGFKVMSHQSSTKVTMGEHKLSMRAYSELSTQLYRYQAEYRLFNK
ncbi:MAG TPA: hypothetical protein VFY73_23500 [Ideonella sp.]|uniref:hypothetical protein n=1 Tax=Ideonella sp. TaxID=1929293 RepID=UPI002E2FDFFF|nr:hypothetical protein [Ideonella sp.]HEX5686989.1 hypothetical protein [Ideonella sp.]